MSHLASNVILSVLRNAEDIVIVISDLPPRQIKEPNTRGIKEPNLDGTNTNAYKCYKSYKHSNVLIYFDY